MKKVLVLGDRIIDKYSFCKATRLCPEGPAPVLEETEQRTCEGGAGLVAANLRSLMGDQRSVVFFPGSVSHKHRIFADRTLVCRIDKDKFMVTDSDIYWQQLMALLNFTNEEKVDAVVVGDYGKGAMSEQNAEGLTRICTERSIPLFVDAKSDPAPYKNCYAIFPNEHEHNGIDSLQYRHIVRKLGPKGCSVDGLMVHTEEQQVYDVTGAGDVFIAAFVAKYLRLERSPAHAADLMMCAEYANKAAGISVRHLGTYIVRPEEVN